MAAKKKTAKTAKRPVVKTQWQIPTRKARPEHTVYEFQQQMLRALGLGDRNDIISVEIDLRVSAPSIVTVRMEVYNADFGHMTHPEMYQLVPADEPTRRRQRK